MTRGNQREIDRMRAANRHGDKKEKKAGDPKSRNEKDAAALAAKIAKKTGGSDQAESKSKG